MAKVKKIHGNPDWITSEYNEDINAGNMNAYIEEINKNLQSPPEKPDVSIIIPAYNEENNILKAVLSLSRQVTEYSFEIICVDNNSVDKTAEILHKIPVRYFLQTIQGCGPARQKGLDEAKGDYILLADADCIYHQQWLQIMIDELKQEGVSCVYGRFSFISDGKYPRWKLSVHKALRELMAEIRNIKRPYYNSYGMSMGFTRKDGQEIGFIMNNLRGEDGRMCFDLMNRGKVKMIRAKNSRVWTPARALEREGKSLFKIILSKMSEEMKKFYTYFYPLPPHDTKTSKNE